MPHPVTPDFSLTFGADRRGAAQMDLTWHIFVIARKWRARVDELQSAEQLTHARLEALASLEYLPENVQQNELARFMRVEGPTLVRLLDRLEADGFIRRTPYPGDARRKTVALLPAGRALLEQRLAVSARLRNDILEDVPDSELAACLATLQKVLSVLEAEEL